MSDHGNRATRFFCRLGPKALSAAAVLIVVALCALAMETGLLPAWRTTFDGTVTSKSLSRSTPQYSLLQFKLSGEPIVFSSGGYPRRVEPSFAAIRNGDKVRVAVLTMDLRKAQRGQAPAVPILVVEHDGSYVLASEERAGLANLNRTLSGVSA